MDYDHMESLAGDLFQVLESARNTPGLDIDGGFQNRPLASEKVTITYLFYPKKALDAVDTMPKSFKRGLGISNILASLDSQGKKVGIFLLAALNMKFSQVELQADIQKNMNPKGIEDFDGTLRALMKGELEEYVKNKS